MSHPQGGVALQQMVWRTSKPVGLGGVKCLVSTYLRKFDYKMFCKPQDAVILKCSELAFSYGAGTGGRHITSDLAVLL